MYTSLIKGVVFVVLLILSFSIHANNHKTKKQHNLQHTAHHNKPSKLTYKRAPKRNNYIGVASWYGSKFQGQQTASGERFNQSELTAAHKTLPLNSYVKVTNISNNKSVIVRINDRGPHIRGRIIDLSKKAARMIQLTETGIGMVSLSVVDKSS